jgi:hypothetical protein
MSLDWINLASVVGSCTVNTVINVRVPLKTGIS